MPIMKINNETYSTLYRSWVIRPLDVKIASRGDELILKMTPGQGSLNIGGKEKRPNYLNTPTHDPTDLQPGTTPETTKPDPHALESQHQNP